jgi:hypothetical protein
MEDRDSFTVQSRVAKVSMAYTLSLPDDVYAAGNGGGIAEIEAALRKTSGYLSVTGRELQAAGRLLDHTMFWLSVIKARLVKLDVEVKILEMERDSPGM